MPLETASSGTAGNGRTWPVARLAIARGFLAEYAKLQRDVQSAVDAACAKFAKHPYPGLLLEKPQHSQDDRIGTIRVNGFWRGVVLAPATGDTYCLVTVLPPDEANAYAANHRFSVNRALGVLEVRDEEAVRKLQPSLEAAAEPGGRRLFADVSDADLAWLGIDQNVLPAVRLLTSETDLETLQAVVPEAQYAALHALAGGMTVDEAQDEVARLLPAGTLPEQVDPEDLVAAMERTPGQVTFVSGPEDLQLILAHPFAAWRRFLHPSQRKIAYRAGAGNGRSRNRQDGYRAASRGLPGRARRTGAGDHLQRQPGRRPPRPARPADPGRRRAPPDRGLERGPAGLQHRQAGPRRHSRHRGRAGAAHVVGGGGRCCRAVPHPGIRQERVGTGHPGAGPADRASVRDLPAHRPGTAAHEGPAQPGLAGCSAGHRQTGRGPRVHSPAIGQRGHALAPAGGGPALPAHPRGRSPGSAPVTMAAAARCRDAGSGRPVHRGRPAPAHLREPGLPGQPGNQRTWAEPAAVPELPDHAGDPGLGGAAARR